MHYDSHRWSEVYFALCKSLDTPLSLGCWLRHKYKVQEPSELRPTDFDNAYDFGRAYLVHSFLSKVEGVGDTARLESEALETFIGFEAQCLESNRRLRKLRSSSHKTREDLFADRIISIAARKIANCLGAFRLDSVLEYCRWGPGATSTLRRGRARPDLKHTGLPFAVTSRALTPFKSLVESDPAWLNAALQTEVGGPCSLLPCCFEEVNCNRVVTVPKNARKRRVIAAEPTANSYLQQGAGRFIRQRLVRVGVDLSDQTINQAWASMAHQLDLATLDLSSASDTIPRELIFDLLPLDWALWLDSLRSTHGVLPSGPTRRVKYEKFSSMGNAYTFELESLIFWGLCSAVCEGGVVSIYGDDIIVPQRDADDVIRILTYCGFTVNQEKSFSSGRFFESCGRHFFDGVDVTPAYQRKGPVGPLETIRCHNRLYRWGLRQTYGLFVDPLVSSSLKVLRRSWGSGKVPLCPHSHQGDEGFLDCGAELSARGGSFYFRGMVPRSSRFWRHQSGAYAITLRQRDDRTTNADVDASCYIEVYDERPKWSWVRITA